MFGRSTQSTKAPLGEQEVIPHTFVAGAFFTLKISPLYLTTSPPAVLEQ
jgi:hypothetical protein